MTLTEASYWTRRFGVLTIALIVLITLGLTLYFVFRDIIDPSDDALLIANFACTDTKEEFLEERLIIPSLQLSTTSTELIVIDTPSGQADSLPSVANVYEFDHKNPSLIAQQKAQDIGSKLGFNPELIKRRGTIEYYWDEDEYGRRLSINANTLNFELDTNFINPKGYPTEGEIPSNESAKQIATNFMRRNGWLLSDYSESETLYTLLNIEPDGSFSMAQSRAEAELIRVDFYRAKPFIMFRSDLEEADRIKEQLDERYFDYESVIERVNTTDGSVEMYNYLAQVVHQDTQKSNISVYVGPNYRKENLDNAPNDVYAIDYVSWSLPEEPCGTYPLLSTSTVENIIKNGDASLVYLNDINGDTVVPYRPREVSDLSVKQITLAYFDTPEKQKYLQPIYIVLGDATLDGNSPGRFYFYMPAIDYDFLKDRIAPENVPE